MKFAEMLYQLPSDDVDKRVYGEPYQTPDGAIVITVARLRGGGAEKAAGFTAPPVGVFVIRGNRVKWVPAVDAHPGRTCAVGHRPGAGGARRRDNA